MSLPRIQPSGGTPTTQDFVSLQSQWAQQLEPLILAGDGIPIGVMWPWPSATPPTKFLLVQNQLLLITQYQALFNVVGITWNKNGDAAQFFRLPPAPGRVMLFVGTSNATGATAHTLEQTGGEETHLLTATESGLPLHAHPLGFDIGNITNGSNGAGSSSSQLAHGNGVANGTYNPSGQANAGPANASSAHNTLSPYFCANLIIKYLP